MFKEQQRDKHDWGRVRKKEDEVKVVTGMEVGGYPVVKTCKSLWIRIRSSAFTLSKTVTEEF